MVLGPVKIDRAQEDGPPPVAPQPEEDSIPRRLYIRKIDLAEHGYTPGCRGAPRPRGGDKQRRPQRCQDRVEKNTAETERGRQRAVDAKRRRGEDIDEKQEGSDEVTSGAAPADSPALVGSPAERTAPKRRAEVPIEEAARLGAEGVGPRSQQEVLQNERDVQPGEERKARRRRIEMTMANAENESLKERLMLRSLSSNEVSEVFSRPRVALEAPGFGFDQGFSLHCRANGPDDNMPWDFNIEEKRGKARRKVDAEKPIILIGSPPRSPFGKLQELSRVEQEGTGGLGGDGPGGAGASSILLRALQQAGGGSSIFVP